MSDRIIITGATGFIGLALSHKLLQAGKEVVALTRNVEKARERFNEGITIAEWDAQTAEGWGYLAEGAKAIVNLAGENIGSGYWTARKKRRIQESRVFAGRGVSEAVENAREKPDVVIQASGINYYGSRGDTILVETADPGQGFLAEVTKKWEASTRDVSTRQVVLRNSPVLSTEEGMFAKILPFFRYFMGGYPGSGEQWFSWIHLEDLLNAIIFLIENENLNGVFNGSAPEPMRAKQFYSRLASHMNRPAWISPPASLLKIVVGEMAEELLLPSQRVLPKRLLEADFDFRYPDVKSAMANLFSHHPENK